MLDGSSVFVQFALLTKLWFLTSRVSIETLRSSVVCCARYCEVCLFFPFICLFWLLCARRFFSVLLFCFYCAVIVLAALSSFVFFCVWFYHLIRLLFWIDFFYLECTHRFAAYRFWSWSKILCVHFRGSSRSAVSVLRQTIPPNDHNCVWKCSF